MTPIPTGPDAARPARGIVYAATGKDYVTLARRAARTLRAVMPDIEIDLYTDAPLQDDIFAQIHLLEQNTHRPKMEALRRARFERTVYLDADTVVLADVSELFDLLDRYEIVGVPGTARNAQMGYQDSDIPRAFPLINSGMLGVRHSPRVKDFLHLWERTMHDGRHRFDQPVLRRLLWEGDLSLMVAPYEYNLLNQSFLERWKPWMGAPRILHVTRLHERDAGAPDRPFDLDRAVGPERAARVRWLLRHDLMLGGDPRKAGKPPKTGGGKAGGGKAGGGKAGGGKAGGPKGRARPDDALSPGQDLARRALRKLRRIART